jgi:hypothetical protein
MEVLAMDDDRATKTTIDTYTGKPFRWNTTALANDVEGNEWLVPARCTSRDFMHLHPGRVRASLLARLNPGRVVDKRRIAGSAWANHVAEQRL